MAFEQGSKRMSRALHTANLDSDQTLAVLKEGIFKSDSKHRFLYVNDYGARMAGFDNAKQMLDAGVLTSDFFVDPEDFGWIVAMLKYQGEIKDYVCRMKDTQGRYKWIEITVLGAKAKKTKGSYWGVLRDVTMVQDAQLDRDRIHQELFQALRRLEVSEELTRRQKEQIEIRNRDLKEFSAAVVHDLKAPLVSLIGFSQMFFESYSSDLDQNGSHLIDRIRFNAQQLDMIIRGLQELILLGEESEPRVLVNLEQVLHTVLSNRRQQLSASAVKMEIQPNLPPLLAHPTKLYQLLDNLVSNALKVLEGRSLAKVTFGYGCSSSANAYFVEDNGAGVPEDLRERVFELFYRCDKNKPGAGVGLTIVRRIVELYGGRVWVEEGSTGGARFCFEIPNPSH